METALLRAAFESSGLSKGEVAKRMGWIRGNIDQLNRALGYRPDTDSRCLPRNRPRNRMSYELAVRLCTAMDANPFECGV